MKGKLLKHFSFFHKLQFSNLPSVPTFTSTNHILQMGVKTAFQLWHWYKCVWWSLKGTYLAHFRWSTSSFSSLESREFWEEGVCVCVHCRAGGKMPMKPKLTETSWLERRWTLAVCPCTSGKAVTPRSGYNFNHVPGLLGLLKWFPLVSFPQWNKCVNPGVQKLCAPLCSAPGSHFGDSLLPALIFFFVFVEVLHSG